MAVKRKKAKHAGMGELKNMKNRPMILIDPQVQSCSVQAPSQHRSINLHKPTRSAASRHSPFITNMQIPLHLLSHLSATVHQTTNLRGYDFQHCRNYSTRFFRAVEGQSRYRPILTENLPTPKKKASLNHLDASGAAHMVNISEKSVTTRSATASASLTFSSDATYVTLKSAKTKKGDAIAVARIAGIQAAKKTADLIPLAHPGLGLTGVNVEIDLYPPEHLRTYADLAKQVRYKDFRNSAPYPMKYFYGGVQISATVSCTGRTGVEMEALTAANVCALTMYDMLKGIDKCMLISNVRVLSKEGGKSGNWKYDPTRNKIQMVSSETAPSATANPDGSMDNKALTKQDTMSGSQEPRTGQVENAADAVKPKATGTAGSPGRAGEGIEPTNTTTKSWKLSRSKEPRASLQTTAPMTVDKRSPLRDERLLNYRKLRLEENRLLSSRERIQYLRQKLKLEMLKAQNMKKQSQLAIGMQQGHERKGSKGNNVHLTPASKLSPHRVNAQDFLESRAGRYDEWAKKR